MKLDKRRYIATTFGITVLLSSCFKPLSEIHSDESKGFNGSFEHFQNDLPTNWMVYTPNTTEEGDFEIIADQSEFIDGNQSLKFIVNTSSDKWGRFSPGIAQELQVTAGEIYRISFYVKNEGTSFLAKISAVNSFNRDEGLSLNSSENIKTWKRFEYEYTIPEEMDQLRFEFSVQSEGNCWIDAIRIYKVHPNV